MDKQKRLDRLKKEIENCPDCRSAGTGVMVFGEGDLNAKVMFVGEAPGRREAESGRPFIGPSGKLLRNMIREIELHEDEVYIASPVKFFPKKGTPTRKEILHSKTHFDAQVEIINPAIMVLMGKTALSALTNLHLSVLKDHGTVIEVRGRKLLLTIHPAAVLRFRKYEPIMKEDFMKIKNFV